MVRTEERNCLFCHACFVADARNARHQKYCSAPACRQESQAASRRTLLAKTENLDYFRGAENVARVKAWRAAHPRYWQRPKGQGVAAAVDPIALQDVFMAQPIEITEDPQEVRQAVLPDIFLDQAAVLIGFIAHFTGTTLQDDIARSARRLVELGNDILAGRKGDDHQARSLSGAGPADSDSFQLARPPPGTRAAHRAL
ncbi:MAG TPA: hypothetical protein PLR37_14090 [Candidatus Accumulibacter phosphatis]|nr:hypothetical protein [Candidatus Accumulibacter phosphatis]